MSKFIFEPNIEVYCRGGTQPGMTVAEPDGSVSIYGRTGNMLVRGASPAFITHLWCKGWLQDLRTMAEIWAALSAEQEPAPIKIGA